MLARRLLAALFAASLLAPTAAHAAFGDVLSLPLPDDHQHLDFYGSVVAADSGIALVAAPRAGANDTNAVYVIDAADGSVLHKLADPIPRVGDWFGATMVIDGNVAAISDIRDAAVYVYDLTNATLLHTVQSDNASDWPVFGRSLDLDVSNGWLAAGDFAYGETAPSDHIGAAYLFDLSTGAQHYRLLGPLGSSFGASVALDNGLLAVGAPSYGEDGGPGEVFVYDAATGQSMRRIPSGSAFAYDLGHRLAAADGVLIAMDRQDAESFDLHTGDRIASLAQRANADRYETPPAWEAWTQGDGVFYVASERTFIGPGSFSRRWVDTAIYAFDAHTGHLLAEIGVDEDRWGAPWPSPNWLAVTDGTLLIGASDRLDGDTVLALEVSLDMAGDFNGDGVVDAADYTLWRDGLPRPGPIEPINPAIDPNNDGRIDELDYNIWVHTFGDANAAPGAIPEPTAAVLLTLGLLAAGRPSSTEADKRWA